MKAARKVYAVVAVFLALVAIVALYVFRPRPVASLLREGTPEEATMVSVQGGLWDTTPVEADAQDRTALLALLSTTRVRWWPSDSMQTTRSDEKMYTLTLRRLNGDQWTVLGDFRLNESRQLYAAGRLYTGDTDALVALLEKIYAGGPQGFYHKETLE